MDRSRPCHRIPIPPTLQEDHRKVGVHRRTVPAHGLIRSRVATQLLGTSPSSGCWWVVESNHRLLARRSLGPTKASSKCPVRAPAEVRRVQPHDRLGIRPHRGLTLGQNDRRMEVALARTRTTEQRDDLAHRRRHAPYRFTSLHNCQRRSPLCVGTPHWDPLASITVHEIQTAPENQCHPLPNFTWLLPRRGALYCVRGLAVEPGDSF